VDAAAADLDGAIRDLVARGAVPIPPYPAVALQVQRLVGQSDFGLAEIARLVSADAALSADVLRCANSSLHARGAPATNLGQAITRVGAQEVARLALGSGLAAQAQAPGPLAPLKRRIWIESAAGAVLCQELARLRGLRAPEGFVLGLLHDFGRVVATACLEAILERRRDATPRPLEGWAEIVDRHHVPLGLAMAAQWGLPQLVGEVIALHHGGTGPCQDPDLLEVVKVSDRVVALLSSRPEVGDADLAVLPLRVNSERPAVLRIVERIPEFVAAFEPPDPGRPGPPSLVAPPPAALAPGQRPATFRVTVVLQRRTHELAAAAIAANGLVAVGREALPVNQLLEVTLHPPPRPFKLWATARLCRPHEGGFLVELQPYALSGEPRARWAAEFARAVPAA
jgi:HD-like signal output (HDOD) protein